MSGAEQLVRALDALSGRMRAATTIEELEPLIRAQESTLRQIAAINPRELGPAAAASLQNAATASGVARTMILEERKRDALQWREVSQLQAVLASITQSRTGDATFSVEL